MKKTAQPTISPADIAETSEKAVAKFEALSDAALQQVASYFQALAEPTRLQILNLLRHQPCKVGDMAELCACSVANVSRHLSLLQQRGLVTRESRGTSAYYRIADPAIYELCELVCGRLADQAECLARERAAFPFNPAKSTQP
ncbi:metalloregulator ArsR/SmtB family transcription factor [Roseateles sp.]|uniref:ArsR/SmtB family transcription factor n=1 Tax=Roseateles sp. TaxID=1971397 RepID=UPI00286D43F4|nr:metalloregulator ArsR/SmtB family transcription factor [Roseateles sp.]